MTASTNLEAYYKTKLTCLRYLYLTNRILTLDRFIQNPEFQTDLKR